MAAKATDKTLSLISTAYRAAVEPERFEDLLDAWDRWIDAAIAPTQAPFDEILPVFDDAVDLSDKARPARPQTSGTPFDLAPAPGILFDASGRVLATNVVAQSFLAREGLHLNDLVAAAPEASDAPQADDGPATYRIGGGPGQRSFLVVEAPLTDAIRADHPDAARLVLLSQIDWNAAFATELETRLGLSAAELRVARGLLEGQTAQEIAGALGRSLPTIRSHIKVLLQKSGTRRQPELVQLLTILRHVSGGTPARPATPHVADDFRLDPVETAAGALPVVRYGAGDPLIYFTTSSRPEETADLRAALADAGFSVRAPLRPGFADVPQRSRDASTELLDGWLEALADTDTPPLLVGHREGGVLAALAAQRLLAAGRPVAGLALISTGAPASKLSHWRQSPPTVRRSFLAAHLAPAALTLGYNTAVRLFHSGTEGQDRIVRYFFADSPRDKAKLSDPYFYDITRDNIAYCFANPRQIVRDIVLWTRNWSAELTEAAGQVPVLFVHGADHTFFSCSDIAAWVQTLPKAQLLQIEEAGQLALYQAPGDVAKALRALHGHDADRASQLG